MIDNYLLHTPAISNVLVLSAQLSIAVFKALENVSKEKAHAPLEHRLNGTLKIDSSEEIRNPFKLGRKRSCGSLRSFG